MISTLPLPNSPYSGLFLKYLSLQIYVKYIMGMNSEKLTPHLKYCREEFLEIYKSRKALYTYRISVTMSN